MRMSGVVGVSRWDQRGWGGLQRGDGSRLLLAQDEHAAPAVNACPNSCWAGGMTASHYGAWHVAAASSGTRHLQAAVSCMAHLRRLCTSVSPKAWPTAAMTATLPTMSVVLHSGCKQEGWELRWADGAGLRDSNAGEGCMPRVAIDR